MQALKMPLRTKAHNLGLVHMETNGASAYK